MLIGLIVIWMLLGRVQCGMAQVQAWLSGFTGLNLLLDFSNLLILGMALWIISRVTDPALPARFAPLSRKGVLIGVGAGLGAVIVSSAIEFLSDRYLHTNLAQDSTTTMVLPHRADQLALGVFTVAILAPLTEEVYFRGIVLGWMRRHWGMAWAIGSLIARVRDHASQMADPGRHRPAWSPLRNWWRWACCWRWWRCACARSGLRSSPMP